ncbi:MAG: hypothetical protein ABW123_25620 [Cystobacter sp.]
MIKLSWKPYPERERSLPDQGLPVLRLELLANDLLLDLFEGESKTLDFFQAPEGLSFGLDPPTEDPPVYTKNLRDRSGQGTEILMRETPWTHLDKGVLDTAALARGMQSLLASNPLTAPQMLEGGPRTRFAASLGEHVRGSGAPSEATLPE